MEAYNVLMEIASRLVELERLLQAEENFAGLTYDHINNNVNLFVNSRVLYTQLQTAIEDDEILSKYVKLFCGKRSIRR